MATLAELNEELIRLNSERDELRRANPGIVMPAEARSRDSQIAADVRNIMVRIEEKQQEERDSLMNDASNFLNNVNYQIPRAVNDDDAGRKTLLASGWNIKNGMITRQTSVGEVAFIHEDVMFGAMPTNDPVSAETFRQTRATFQPAYRNAWVAYLKARGNLSLLTGSEQAALSEGVVEAGGQLVPAEIAAEILIRRARASVMRQICSIRQTSRNQYEIPAVTPNASSGSIYSSGFVGGLVGETPTSNTDNGPTFQNFAISVKKYEAYTKVSNDLIADAVIDIMGFLSVDGARNLGLVEDNYFLTGDGTGLQPLGLLNCGADTFDVEGATSNTLDNSVSNAGSAPKIIAGYYVLPQQYADGASWLVSRATQGLIHALVDADGRPWWQPASNAGGEGVAPPVLVGAPLRTSAFMPEDGTNANKVMVLGDFSQAIIADRQGISTFIENSPKRGSDQTEIFLRSRSGFGVWNTDAFRFGIV